MDSLPLEVLITVMEHLNGMLFWVPYLLNLRLVNKKFNEAALHAEFISESEKKRTRQKRPRLTPEMTSLKYFDPQCAWTRILELNEDKSIYAQMYLQAKLRTQKSSNQQHSILFGQLRKAANILERMLSKTSATHTEIKDNTSKYIPLSHNQTFTNVSQIIICRAALSYLGFHMTGKCFPTCPQGIEEEPPAFWLINAACYLGSASFLDEMQSSEMAADIGVQGNYLVTAAFRCLFTVIYNGHRILVRKILRNAPKQSIWSKNMQNPFRACVFANDLDSAKHLLDYQNKVDMQRLSLEALLCWYLPYDSRRLPRYDEIFQLLWPFVGRTCSLSKYALVRIAGHSGSIQVIKCLAKQKALFACLPEAGPRFHAMREPAVLGHRDCLVTLLDHGFGPRISQQLTHHSVKDAAKAALKANHIEIYTELTQRFDIFEESDWFEELAAADGAIPFLQQYLERDNNLLKAWGKSGKTSIGQAALEQAISYLRIENVKFLLQLGIRFDKEAPAVTIDWPYYIIRKRTFEAMQEFLQANDIPRMVITV